MNAMSKILVGAVAGIVSSVSLGSNDPNRDFYDIRDVVASSAGSEVIVPYCTHNAAGSTATVHFNVYPGSSSTKLFSTTSAFYTMPAASPIFQNGCGNDTRVLSSGNFQVVTFSGFNPSAGTNECATLLYVADVSQPGGVMWKQMEVGSCGVDSLKLVDFDGDTIPELVVITDTPHKQNSERVDVYNLSTGAVVTSPVDRPWTPATP